MNKKLFLYKSQSIIFGVSAVWGILFFWSDRFVSFGTPDWLKGILNIIIFVWASINAINGYHFWEMAKKKEKTDTENVRLSEIVMKYYKLKENLEYNYFTEYRYKELIDKHSRMYEGLLDLKENRYF